MRVKVVEIGSIKPLASLNFRAQVEKKTEQAISFVFRSRLKGIPVY